MKSFPDEMADRFKGQSDLARAAARLEHHLDALQRWTKAEQIASDLYQYYHRRPSQPRIAAEWFSTTLYASTQASHARSAVDGEERELTGHGDYISPAESAAYRQRAEEQRIRSEATFAALAASLQARKEQTV